MENPELYRNATKQSLQIERDEYKQIKVINYFKLVCSKIQKNDVFA